MQTKLIGFPQAGLPWMESPRTSRYSLITQGLRVGLGTPQGLAGSDITGHQGTGTGHGHGHGQTSVFFADGEVSTVPTAYVCSPGTGAATLYQTKVMTRGPRKGQTVRVAVVAKRHASRGRAIGSKARSTGRGLDEVTQRATSLESWLCPLQPFTDKIDPSRQAQRARIMSEIASEQDLAQRLQGLGQRAARRQARRLIELRGVKPSQTSVDDAAQDAIVGVLEHVRRLDKAKPEHWLSMRFVRVLALYAGRAAFNSYCSWSRVGITGDNTGAGTAANWCEFVRDTLDTLHQGETQPGDYTPSDARARRAIVRWVFNIGLRQFAASLPVDMRGTARASAIAAARRRCRVVGSILFGASLTDALLSAGGTYAVSATGDKVFHPGFASANAFQDSCKAAGFWTALKTARRASLASVPGISDARGWQRAWAIDAVQAVRDLRGLGSAGAWRDTFSTDTLKAQTVRGIKATARTLQRRTVLDTLRESVTMAQYFKALADKRTRENLRAFERIADGMKSGTYDKLTKRQRAQGKVERPAFADLSRAVMPRNRKGAQSALIGRARGKVSKPVVLAPTVPVKVQTQYGERKLHCVPSVSVQPWAMLGDAGFTVCKAPKAS